MSSRETVLNRVRRITEALPKRSPLPSAEAVAHLSSRLVPVSDDEPTLVEQFCRRWKEASGVVLEGVAGLEAFLKEEGVSVGYVDPEALVSLGVESIAGAKTVYDRSEVDIIQFGITRASFAAAETGTIALTDGDTSNRLAALAPWVHVAVLSRHDIKRSLADAISAFDDDPSIVFVTGPSKTADIEGILIEGVHGPGKQAVLLV